MSLGTKYEFVRVRSTNECTTCDLCGREELKCTIELIAIDRETGDREEVYYGAGCAKKALGWGPGMTVKRFERAAMEKREVLAIAAEKIAEDRAEKAAYAAFRARWPMDDLERADNLELARMDRKERLKIVNAYFEAKDAAVKAAKLEARKAAMAAPIDVSSLSAA